MSRLLFCLYEEVSICRSKKKKEKKKKKLLSEKPASFRSTSMGIINSVDGPDALTICMTVKCQ